MQVIPPPLPERLPSLDTRWSISSKCFCHVTVSESVSTGAGFQELHPKKNGNRGGHHGPRHVLFAVLKPDSVEEVQRVAGIIHIVDAPSNGDETEQCPRSWRIARAVEQVL